MKNDHNLQLAQYKRPMKIIQYPNKILTQPAQKVNQITPKIKQLVEAMIQTMRQANGVGLAAPQVGESLRLAVIEYRPQKNEEFSIPLTVLVNPKIIARSKTIDIAEEGCLSIPDIEVPVPRSIKIKVKAQNLDGNPIRITASGLSARIFQHEIDHLDGKLIIDYKK